MPDRNDPKRASQTAAAHIPTSATLIRMIAEAPRGKVSLAWLVGHLQGRSFGLLLLILSFFGLAPGIATFAGFLLAIPAVEMILGHERPTLPRFLAERSIPTPQFTRWTARIIPPLTRLEKFIRPRLATPFQATKRLVGLVVLLLAITIIWPLPLVYIVPSLVIMLVSFAYLEEDGLLLCVSLLAAILSFAFTAATVWATFKAAGSVETLWVKLLALGETPRRTVR